MSDKLGVESKELGVHFLVEALLDEDEPLVPQVKAKKAYMIAACGQDAKLQMALACALELFLTESAPEEFKKYVEILKTLYDEDVGFPAAYLTFRGLTVLWGLALMLLLRASWSRGLDRLVRPRALPTLVALGLIGPTEPKRRNGARIPRQFIHPLT